MARHATLLNLTTMPEPSAALPDPLMSALREAVSGQFTVTREIGRGGMGVVYLAHDVKLDRAVALKVLPLDQGSDPAARERFLREARTAAQLAHPNIVPVHRADELAGIALFAMAYVDGESVAERLRNRGPFSAADAVRVLREAAWALAYAHARGVIHRDVKPENILLDRITGRALVTDFGIAHRASDAATATPLTQPHAILGTLHYMSPEQVNGIPLDGRSDLYSLGVVAYELLSGRLPFAGMEGTAVLVAHATHAPPPLATVAPNVPAALAAVVDRCLAKLPDDRYSDGESLAEALEQALEDVPDQMGLPAAYAVAGLPSSLSEAQAEAIWRRAAQLQADASRRLEERGDLLTRGHDRRAIAGDGADASSPAATGTYALSHVVAAAREAGISAQYVAMAVAELPREVREGGDAGAALALRVDSAQRISESQAVRFLGTETRSLAVSFVIPAAPARALRMLGAILQQLPYELQLRETVGAHPLDGGVLVFDLPGNRVGLNSAMASTVNFYWMGTFHQLDARQLQVTMRAIPGDPGRTEVTMTCDLRPGVRGNVRAAQWSAAVAGTGSGALTGAILAKGAAVFLSAAVLAPAALVGVAALGGTIYAYRRMYTGVLDKARGEMLGALRAVAGAVQSEEVFGVMPGPGRAVRPAGGMDDATLLTIIAGS